MHFFEPSRFAFLWLIPLAFLIWKWGRGERRRRLERWGEAPFLERRLMPAYSPSRPRWCVGLLLAVLFFSTLALTRPQWGEEKKRVERKGVDLIFLLDTSLSMLAEDIKPNRLTKAKLEIKNLIRHLKGDRVGMVGFAGSGFLQCPLTLDYAAFLLFVDALKPGYLPTPGTSLAEAIRLSVRAFPAETRKYRAILVFSDGEDHEGGMEEALAEAKKSGIRIYTIGTGTTEGEPIPLRSGTDPRTTTGYKKDRNGQVVITRLNAPLLAQMAKETEGLYFQATAGEREADLILKHLETLGERRLREKLITEREDHFQIFLLLAFLLLIAENWIRNPIRMGRPSQALLLFISFILFSAFLDSPSSLVKKGNELSNEKKYQSAVENYRKAQVIRPEEPVIRYNLGTALYQLHEYRDAERELGEALAKAKGPGAKARILYNYGNAQYRLGDFDKAIDSYKKVLEIDPKDEDAKYNLEFLQKQKSMFEKKQEEKQNQQKQKQQPQPKPRNDQQQNPQQRQSQSQDQQQNQQQQQQPQEQSQGGGLDQQQDQQAEGNQKEHQQQRSQGEEETKGQEEEQRQGMGDLEEQKQEQQKEDERQQPSQPDEQGQPVGSSHEPAPLEQPSPAQTTPREAPLQGQMTKENALQILDVLQEGEKQLQDIRKPPGRPEAKEVLKDW